MAAEISETTLATIVDHARQHGVSADDYLARLIAEADEQSHFCRAVEQGLADIDQGRVVPAREALLNLGQRFGFSR